MKKLIAVCLSVLLLVLAAGVVCAEEEFDPTEPADAVELALSTSFDNPTEVYAGVFYYAKGNTAHQLVFYPKETGVYAIYGRTIATPDPYSSFCFRITDKYNQEIGWKFDNRNQRKPLVSWVELEAGKEYHFNRGDMWGIWNYMDFNFAICAPSQHVGGLSDYSVVQEPTCTEPGYEAQRCLLCGGEANRREIPAKGHTAGDGEIAAEATCLSEGVKLIKCADCGQVLSREILPMIDHQPGQFIQVVASTCTTPGRNEQHCTMCNALLATEETEPFGHVPGAWTELVPVTAESNGLRVQQCVICGETLKTETISVNGSSIE